MELSRILRRHMVGVQLSKSQQDIDESLEDVNLHKAFNELDTQTGSEPDGFISNQEVETFLKQCKKHGFISKKQKETLMKAFIKLWGKSKRINFVQFKDLVKSNEPWRKIFCRFNQTDILLCIAPEDCGPEDSEDSENWQCWDKYYCQLEGKNPYCYNPPNCNEKSGAARIHCQDKWECENLKPADDPWCNNPPTCTDQDCLNKWKCDNYPETCLLRAQDNCDQRDNECLKEYNCKQLPESPQCLHYNNCDSNDWQCNEKWDCDYIRPADDPQCNNPPTCEETDQDCLRKWQCENYPEHPDLDCYIKIPNCIDQNDDEKCSSCNNNYQLITGNPENKCVKNIPKCKTYNPQGKCSNCETNQEVKDGACARINNTENCINVDFNTGNCKSCIGNQVLKNNQCFKKIPNCNNQNNNGKCSNCNNDYQLITGNPENKCVKNIPKCKTYNPQGKCSNCENNQEVKDGACARINNTENCINVDFNTGKCKSCSSGQVLKNNQCFKKIPNCNNQNNNGKCSNCNNDYQLITGNNENNCVKKIPKCKSYNNQGNCSKCQDNQDLKNQACDRINDIEDNNNHCTQIDPNNKQRCLSCDEGQQKLDITNNTDMIMSMKDYIDSYNADNDKIKTFGAVMLINTLTGKLLTSPKLNDWATLILDDFDRTSHVKKIKNSNKQKKQRYSFKKNNGIQITFSKKKNNKKRQVDVAQGKDNHPVGPWPWHGGENQLFSYDQDKRRIKLKNKDWYLTTKDNGSNNGTEIYVSSNPGIQSEWKAIQWWQFKEEQNKRVDAKANKCQQNYNEENII